jgi:DNA-binding LytR/AlgR family response regulator
MTKCVVAEDETLLRLDLIKLLQESWPELDIISCNDGIAAVEAIVSQHVEVAFLDIQMPGLTGLQVASTVLAASPHTSIVFVTAYDQHALTAFEQGAVDYLLKPVARERLVHTLARIRARPNYGQTEVLANFLERLDTALLASMPYGRLSWIPVNNGRETRLIMVADVLYFKADTKYTVVVTEAGEALVKKSLRDLLALLDPTMFQQVHRSTVINLTAIQSITRDDTGRGLIQLKNRQETLLVSQPYMSIFRGM